MKDIHISAKRQKTEMKWFFSLFCATFLLNIISIFIYKTRWTEVYTQLLWVLALSCFFYLSSVLLRLAVYFIRRLLSNN